MDASFTRDTITLNPLSAAPLQPQFAFVGTQVVAIQPESPTEDAADAVLFALGADNSWRRIATGARPGAVVHAIATAREDTVVFGGAKASLKTTRGVLLRPDATGTIVTEELPPLPQGLQVQAAAIMRGRWLYLAAGKDDSETRFAPHLLTLSLGGSQRSRKWTDLGAIVGGVGRVSAMAAQSDGERLRLYIFSAPPVVGASTTIANFEPLRGVWETLPARPDLGIVAYATPVGVHQIFTAGNQDGRSNSAEIRAFNTVTHAWTEILGWETSDPVVASAAGFRGLRMLTAGSGGVHLHVLEHPVQVRGLHPLDHVVLAAFFLTLVAISWAHSRRSKSAEGYFRGGRRLPWLAAGLSVVATRLSATSFVSIPAKSFATNWQYTLIPVTNIVGAFIMTRYFVRFFVRLNVTSGYEYLEKRFNTAVRTLGSLNYLLYELARIGILILVPAVALYAVAKFDLSTTIVVIGVVVTIYTVIGGIEGVVWADVFQVGVKVIGLLVAIGFVFAQLDGSLVKHFGDAWRAGKLRLVDVSWDFTRDTLWVFILFWITDGLKSYVANQTIIQRFISTKDERAAGRTIWSSAIIGTLVSWLFLLLGTGLYLFYRQQPARLDVTMDKPDGVLPWFIVFELPAGIAGLLIAALIAAATSSLAGALNSTSTVLVTDFYRRFASHASDDGALRLGKVLTAVIGLLATGLALLMAQLSNKSLFDQTLSMIGLFGGGLGGLFLLGMLTTRAGSTAALTGLLVSAAVQYYVSRHTALHLLTYMFTGMSSCLLAGYLASLIWPERKNLDGLTVHTCARRAPAR